MSKLTGSPRTTLGTAIQRSQRTALRSDIGRAPRPRYGTVTSVMTVDQEGEMVFLPYVQVVFQGSTRPWPYMFRIANSPDEIDSIYGGLENINEERPRVKITFTGNTQTRGFVHFGQVSLDHNQYNPSKFKEYHCLPIM
jgi:hypothetical protein